MLHAKLLKGLVSGFGPTRFEVLVASSDAFDSFPVILLLPFEVSRQGFIQGSRPVAPCVPESAEPFPCLDYGK
jgi:hypothetical protein